MSIKLPHYTSHNNERIKNFFVALFLVAISQATNVKIFGATVGALSGFIILPVIVVKYRKIPCGLLWFMFVLIFWVISSLSVTPFMNFYFPADVTNILKHPYFISLARFTQLLACIGIALFVYCFAKRKLESKSFYNGFLYPYLKINLIFAIIYSFAWIAVYFGHGSWLVYGDHRLRGMFVEGGPLGLYYAFVVFISLIFRASGFFIVSYLVVIAMAQSKAGIIGVAVFYMLEFAFRISRNYRFVVFGVILVAALSLTWFIAGNYIKDLKNIDRLVYKQHSNPSIVMGRIAAAYIGPRIVEANPLLGVGLGNYSLVRNDPNYLGHFPAVKKWDLTGLGIFTIVIECGLLGTALFFLIIAMLYYRSSNASKLLMCSFLLPMFLGVQVYFVYPWVALGVALAINSYNRADSKGRIRIA